MWKISRALAASLLLAHTVTALDYIVSLSKTGQYTTYEDGYVTGDVITSPTSISYTGIAFGADGAILKTDSAWVDVNIITPLVGSAGNFTINKASRISVNDTAGFQLFKGMFVNGTSKDFIYYDDQTAAVFCGPFTDGDLEAGICMDTNGITRATFLASFAVKSTDSWNITFSTAFSGQALSTIVGSSVARLRTLQVDQQLTSQIRSAMIARGSALKSFANTLYATAILQMVLLCALAAYFWHRIPMSCFRKKSSFPVLFIVFVIIAIIVTAVTGIFGFLAMEVFLLASVFFGFIAKCCCCKNSDDEDPWGGKGTYDDQTTCQKLSNWRVLILFFAMAVILFDIIWIVTDSIPAYKVYSRPDNKEMTEFQPHKIAKSIAAVYAYHDVAEKPLKVNYIFQIATSACGTEYKKTLNSDADKKKAIYDGFISLYSIDMSIYDPQDYKQYNSVNEWFSRKINATLRPIAEPDNDAVISSPADSRVVGFQKIGTDQEVWLKGTPFTVKDIVNGDAVYQEFMNGSESNGALIINRLSPQDYHRYHSPVNGTVRKIISISGQYQSVNADAVSSGNEVLVENVRTALVIDAYRASTATTHPVLFIAIGANCVGSLVFSVKEGDVVARGQDIGYFQFGGSTTVLITQSNVTKIDDDIQRRSFSEVETYLHVGEQIATFLN